MIESESIPLNEKISSQNKIEEFKEDFPKRNKESSSKEEENNPKLKRTVESIREEYGLGKITLLIFLSVSLGIMADGMEMTLMGLFLIPIRDFYNLNQQQLQMVSSVLFLGIAIASYLAGIISKKLTRIKSIKLAYILFLISHIVLSFSYNIIIFGIARFCIGLSLGLIVPLSLNLLSEYAPKNISAFCLTAVWLFFSVGQCISCCVMMIAMPNLEGEKLPLNLFILSSQIIVAMFVNYFFLVENPKILLMNNQNEEAFEILNKMLKEKEEDNKKEGKNSSKYSQLTEEEKSEILREKEEHTKRELINTMEKENVSLDDLFKEDLLKITLIQIGLVISLSFMLYGVLLISSLTMDIIHVNNSLLPKDNVYNQIIYDQFKVGLISIPGCILGGLCCEWKYLGKKRTMILGFAIASFFSLFIIIYPYIFPYILSLYITFVNLAFNVTLTFIVEIYPSKLKDLSSGFLFGCLRIAGFLSQFAYLACHNWYYLLPYVVSLSLGICSTFLSAQLPEDNNEKDNENMIGIENLGEENKNEIKEAEPLNINKEKEEN